MKASIQLRLAQHLALTPQLQQSIRLLQLSTLELNQELEQALMDNPLLERDDDPLAGHARLAADGSIMERGPAAEPAGSPDGNGEAEAGQPSSDSAGAAEGEPDFHPSTLDWGSPREARDDDEESSPLGWAAAEATLDRKSVV